MEELIRIQKDQQGNSVVSARELHKFLIKDAKGGQVGEDFSHWIKRCLDYGFSQDADYEILEYNYEGNLIAKNSESDNQEVRVHKRDYVLTLDCAKQIAMIQNNDKGREARKYFLDCEKKVQQTQKFQLPNFEDPSEAARAWANERDGRILSEKQNIGLNLVISEKDTTLALQAPKVDFYDAVTDSTDAIDIGQAAKNLKIKLDSGKILGRNGLFDLLRIAKVLRWNNEPYQTHIDRGWFRVIEVKYRKPDGSTHIQLKTLVLQKGLDGIRKLFHIK